MQKNTLPTILDVEASGFGAASYPIEIGVVRYDGAKWCKLIRPFDDWVHWDKKAEALHGISLEMLNTHGVEPVRVCRELNSFLGNTIAYSDGWVVDNPWLIKLYATAQVEMSFSCRALEYILKQGQMDIWHQEKNRLAKELDTRRHRASADALLIQQTYAQTRCLSQK